MSKIFNCFMYFISKGYIQNLFCNFSNSYQKKPVKIFVKFFILSEMIKRQKYRTGTQETHLIYSFRFLFKHRATTAITAMQKAQITAAIKDPKAGVDRQKSDF